MGTLEDLAGVDESDPEYQQALVIARAKRAHTRRLAAEIRKHVASGTPGDPPGYWWYDGGRDADLPFALAADLVAAGWRHDGGSCGTEV